MQLIKLRRNSKPWKILRTLLIGGGFLLVAATIAPAGGAQIARGLIKDYFRKKRFEREKFLRDLKNLQYRKLVDYQELPNGEIRITLTRLGKQRILEYNIDDIRLDKKRWDGKWRMVMFDIPHRKKKGRDALRQKLRTLEFYPIQKSVFITPYECEKEIDFVGSFYNVRNHILIFEIGNFEGEEKLKHYFKISS